MRTPRFRGWLHSSRSGSSPGLTVKGPAETTSTLKTTCESGGNWQINPHWTSAANSSTGTLQNKSPFFKEGGLFKIRGVEQRDSISSFWVWIFSVFSDRLLKHSLLFKASHLVKKAPSNLEFSSNCLRELSELGPAGPALGGRTHHGKATTLMPFCTSPLPRSGHLLTFSGLLFCFLPQIPPLNILTIEGILS